MVLAPLEPCVGDGQAPPAIGMAQGASLDGKSRFLGRAHAREVLSLAHPL